MVWVAEASEAFVAAIDLAVKTSAARLGVPMIDVLYLHQWDATADTGEALEQYRWRDQAWRRPPLRGRAIYELHLGTFTPEGSFVAAIQRLDEVVHLGIQALDRCAGRDEFRRHRWTGPETLGAFR